MCPPPCGRRRTAGGTEVLPATAPDHLGATRARCLSERDVAPRGLRHDGHVRTGGAATPRPWSGAHAPGAMTCVRCTARNDMLTQFQAGVQSAAAAVSRSSVVAPGPGGPPLRRAASTARRSGRGPPAWCAAGELLVQRNKKQMVHRGIFLCSLDHVLHTASTTKGLDHTSTHGSSKPKNGLVELCTRCVSSRRWKIQLADIIFPRSL